MLLRRLELVDVRSYRDVVVGFGEGVTVLVGPNAQGKTNLLEAVHRVATGGSHRVAGDGPLVRAGQDVGLIRCEIVADDGRRRTVEVEIGSGRRLRLRVDGQDVRRLSEVAGVVRVVLFAPEDLAIVRGDPSERRRFLDELLTQRRPAFAAARADYERALRQRNQLLKQARVLPAGSRASAMATIDAWSEQLVTYGTQVVAARIAAVRALGPSVDGFYRGLADRADTVRLEYVSSLADGHAVEADRVVPDPAPIAAAFRERLAASAADELARGMTLVGPHRDDLSLHIGALPARGYSSHGEAWSLALALKLATFEVLSEVGDRPIVLLDDVFAELDVTRRDRLAQACGRFEQVIVTAAVEDDVPLAGARFDVAIGDGISIVTPRVAGQGAA